jgi:alkylation response protein AidB-like acyl-CoA dehydrogenase
VTIRNRQTSIDVPGLSDDERQIVELVASFVDDRVRPVVRSMEHANEYPAGLIDAMMDMGVFGLRIPEPWGQGAVSMPCFALVTVELARGWISLAGAFGGHSVVSTMVERFGRPDQRDELLPLMATGEIRATMALTEPSGGSDLQAIRTVARRDADGYVVNGSKTWISNAIHSDITAVLLKTDPTATPVHRGFSVLLATKGDGFNVSPPLGKLGYKGVESCELQFDDLRLPQSSLLGDAEGHGFAQMMTGLEVGRIQVAARAVGVAQAALDDALRYSQERESFGQQIWRHQAVGQRLADMATKVEAARQLLLHAARSYEAGHRADVEAGMAKLFASEVCAEVTLDAIRVHGGYGYSTEFDVERYYRDAPLTIVGEGTNEILRGVIAKQLIARSNGC